MKIAVLSNNYPSETNLPGDMFVHTRCRWYVKQHNVRVFLKSKLHGEGEFTYDSVEGVCGDKTYLMDKLKQFSPDVLVVHSPNIEFMSFAEEAQLKLNVPKATWIHGWESLFVPFYYPVKLKPVKEYAGVWLRSLIQLRNMRRYIEAGDNRGDCVIYVSEWLRAHAGRCMAYVPRNYRIIPNPIDSDCFRFKLRQGPVKRLICVKSHQSPRYAIDLTIRSLSGSAYSIDIYGDGRLYDSNVALACRLNVKARFFREFLTHEKLAEIYQEYDMGIMLSRFDTHGVTTGEMQMAGLPVITSRVAAIPEFKTSGTILVSNRKIRLIPEIIAEINKCGNLAQLSIGAHNETKHICEAGKICRKELELLESLVFGRSRNSYYNSYVTVN